MGWTDFDPTDTGNDVFITSVDLNSVAEFRGGQTYGKEAARCRPGYSNGKWYFEFEANIGFQNISVGVGTIAADIHNEVGFDNFGWCCWLAGFWEQEYYNCAFQHNNEQKQGVSWIPSLPPFGSPARTDRFMVAIDIDAGKIWFGCQGQWAALNLHVGDPANGLYPLYDDLFGAFHVMASGLGWEYYDLIDVATIISNPCNWLYDPPAGFHGMHTPTGPVIGGGGIHSGVFSRGDGMFLGAWKIDEYLTFPANTHSPDTSAAMDADAAPAYRVYEDETGTPLLTGTMAKLDDTNTTGFYSERIQLTAASGFEEGKSYTIYISAAVDGITGTLAHSFQIEAAAIDITIPPVKPWTAWPWPHA